MNVTILGKPYPVTLPARHAETYELALARYTNLHRGSAAMLLALIPGLAAPVVKGGAGLEAAWTLKSVGYDWQEYGARAWDVLRKAGLTDTEIVELAAPIDAELTARAFPARSEVEEVKDFTAASGGA